MTEEEGGKGEEDHPGFGALINHIVRIITFIFNSYIQF